MGDEKYIEKDIQNKFDFHNYGHALEILHEAFPEEWGDEWKKMTVGNPS